MVSTYGNLLSSASLRKELSFGYYCGQEGWGQLPVAHLVFFFKKGGQIFICIWKPLQLNVCIYVYEGIGDC